MGRGCVDEHVPPAKAASAMRDARNPRYLLHPYLIAPQSSRLTKFPIEAGPEATEDRPASKEASRRFILREAVHTLGCHVVLDYVAFRPKTVSGRDSVYDHALMLATEDTPAVGPDVLQAVAHPSLVVGALEHVAVREAVVVLDL